LADRNTEAEPISGLTLDTYTESITPARREAKDGVVQLFISNLLQIGKEQLLHLPQCI